MRYEWPGNVRELENTISAPFIMARGGMVALDALPEAIQTLGASSGATSVDLPAGRSLKEVEKEMILRTLAESGGNRTQASKILGISRRTLQLKLKEYGVNPD